jgi:hypothetical protein
MKGRREPLLKKLPSGCYLIRDRALNGAGVVAAVDLLEGREVDVAVVRHHHAPVLLDKVGKVVAGPVELNVCKKRRFVTSFVE